MSFDERIRFDTADLTNWSLRLDLMILAKTLRSVPEGRIDGPAAVYGGR